MAILGPAPTPVLLLEKPARVARDLFPATALSLHGRAATMADLVRWRDAYLAGVEEYRACAERAYYDGAERLTLPKPRFATSYDDRELRAFGWGWDDALAGRFA